MQKDASVVILAAGFSSRMGKAKFALKFDNKRNFLQKIVDEYITFDCKEIIIILNPESFEIIDKLKLSFQNNVKIIINEYPERERFYSLQQGLKALTNPAFIFIQNVDNPFIDNELLNSLYHCKEKDKYIVPIYKGKGGHPILLSNKIVKSIINEKDFNQNLKRYLKEYRILQVQILNHNILRNLNDLKDYKRFLK